MSTWLLFQQALLRATSAILVKQEHGPCAIRDDFSSSSMAGIQLILSLVVLQGLALYKLTTDAPSPPPPSPFQQPLLIRWEVFRLATPFRPLQPPFCRWPPLIQLWMPFRWLRLSRPVQPPFPPPPPPPPPQPTNCPTESILDTLMQTFLGKGPRTDHQVSDVLSLIAVQLLVVLSMSCRSSRSMLVTTPMTDHTSSCGSTSIVAGGWSLTARNDIPSEELHVGPYSDMIDFADAIIVAVLQDIIGSEPADY